METSVEDRFANLFTSGIRPPLPDLDRPHLAETEEAPITDANHTKWKIPDVAQYPRRVGGEQPKPASGADLLTSSDDDDYVAAFSSKPKMKSRKSRTKKKKPQPRKMPEPDAFGYPSGSHIEPKGQIGYVPRDKDSKVVGKDEADHDMAMNQALAPEDEQGNPAVGHFCQLDLVAKFPYKYMVDENDRVSRHFFTNNKFYQRKWDL